MQKKGAKNKRINENVTRQMKRAISEEGWLQLRKSVEEQIADALDGIDDISIDIELLRDELLDYCGNETNLYRIEITNVFIESCFNSHRLDECIDYYYDDDLNTIRWVDFWSESFLYSRKTLIHDCVLEMENIIGLSGNNGRTFLFLDAGVTSPHYGDMQLLFYGRDLIGKNMLFNFKKREITDEIGTAELAYVQFLIAEGCLKGKFGEKALNDSKKWYWKSASNGYGVARDIVAQEYTPEKYYLAMRYFEGEDIEKDTAKAIEILEELALEDDDQALFRMGLEYLTGEVCKKDTDKGIDYLYRAAEKNNSDALSLLGGMYCLGEDVEQDIEKGLALLKKSKRLGNSNAMYNYALFLLQYKLANISIKEKEYKEIYVEAIRNLTSASFLGHKRADILLKELLSD